MQFHVTLLLTSFPLVFGNLFLFRLQTNVTFGPIYIFLIRSKQLFRHGQTLFSIFVIVFIFSLPFLVDFLFFGDFPIYLLLTPFNSPTRPDPDRLRASKTEKSAYFILHLAFGIDGNGYYNMGNAWFDTRTNLLRRSDLTVKDIRFLFCFNNFLFFFPLFINWFYYYLCVCIIFRPPEKMV